MEAGENVSVLARELGVSRKSIYKWRDRYRLAGSDALRGRGRMTKAERSAQKKRCSQQNKLQKSPTSLVGGAGTGAASNCGA